MSLPKPPAIPGILAALILGIAVPFLIEADAMPAECSPSLARERLGNLLATPATPLLRDRIYAVRPGLVWQAIPGATRYEIEIFEGDRLYVGRTPVANRWYLVRDPARIQPGVPYRLVVRGFDAAGAAAGAPRESTFSLAASDERDDVMRKSARFARAQKEWILAGLFAHLGSPVDAAGALLNYLEAAPGGADADLARRVLSHLGLK